MTTFLPIGTRVSAVYHGTALTGVVIDFELGWGGGLLVRPDPGWTHNGRSYDDGVFFPDATTSSDAYPREVSGG